LDNLLALHSRADNHRLGEPAEIAFEPAIVKKKEEKENEKTIVPRAN
jgi:hypothetical protein